jgi:hypothetical protein
VSPGGVRCTGGARTGLLALALALPWAAAAAFDFAGDKRLSAHTRDGATVVLGTVRFEPAATPGAPVRFALRWTPGVLTDHFLSMREFKCLAAPAEVSCHVPYPYPQPSTVSATELGWLEHSLLFLYKRPADHGAKLWNGVIFRFQVTPDALVGTAQAVDLNRISAPPDNPGEPPFTDADRDDFAPGARWITRLRID